ncbi:MAG: FtsQ-type POTRA domain-containing protein [Spirochaetales bacterium]|nr:FtsQ-type POTRA domain-containing protein [Spirochaetales bacterium]
MSSLPIWELQKEYFEEPEKPRRNRAATLLKIIIMALLLFFTGEVVYYLFLSRSMLIEEVHVDAPEGFALTNTQIVSLSGFSGAESVFSVDTAVMEARIESYPSVLDAVVKEQFPNKLLIHVIPRTPVAVLLAGDRVKAFCVDQEGVLFRSPFPEEGLPILSGVKTADVKFGDRIHGSLTPMLNGLENLRTNRPVIYNLLSEIKIQRLADREYDGWLYFSHSRVKARTDLDFAVEQMEHIVLMIDLVEKQGIAPGVEELDFRSGNVVLKMREE